MFVQRDYGEIFLKNIVVTEFRQLCAIIPTENIIVSHVKNYLIFKAIMLEYFETLYYGYKGGYGELLF